LCFAPVGDVHVTRLYVYSFLEVRKVPLGASLLQHAEPILQQELEAVGIPVQQLWYRDVPVRSIATALRPAGFVPVARTIEDNRAAETAFGPSHRLVVVPTATTFVGTAAGTSVEIRWDLVDAKTGKRIWASQSEVVNTKLFSREDNADERARMLVRGFVEQLRNAGIIR